MSLNCLSNAFQNANSEKEPLLDLLDVDPVLFDIAFSAAISLYDLDLPMATKANTNSDAPVKYRTEKFEHVTLEKSNQRVLS